MHSPTLLLTIRVVSAAALLTACAGPAPETSAGPPRQGLGTSSAITVDDLRSRLYAFADDSMMGREAGTRGNAMGTAYIAVEAARIGLEPAGDSGTWFQDIQSTSNRFASPDLVSEVAVRVANLDQRPTVDKPVGAPDAACVQ